ncbi:MAG: thrombospondin type 3 repeat-containing protein [Candidatus Schekmanbacteria bacterium]|nr:thrombospondin type 3 repeat-containing protein [Candidatus Schekmanbacteria bacterium]
MAGWRYKDYGLNSYFGAYLWDENSGLKDLPRPADKSSVDIAQISINNSGQIVGNWHKQGFSINGRIFRWDALNGIEDLGLFEGASSTVASDLNDSGVIVGSFNKNDVQGVLIYQDDEFYDLNGLIINNQGIKLSFAYAINNNGQIVAQSENGDVVLLEPYNEADKDGDNILDLIDNCLNINNPDQCDTDSDGYGNICDADLNNDGRVNTLDLGLFKKSFQTPNAPQSINADFNCDGRINTIDLGVFKTLLQNRVPGPSGITQLQ